MYTVILNKTATKQRKRVPVSVKQIFEDALSQLTDKGPVLPDWVNSGTLDDSIYHCRLNANWITYCKYKESSPEIEIFYVGRADQAPY